MAILIKNDINVRLKKVIQNKEDNFLIIKECIQHHEEITQINIGAPNEGSAKYLKRLLRDPKKDANSNTIVVQYFNTTLSPLNQPD